MESNEILREQISQVIDNQMKEDSPPETRLTFQRLKDLGYSDYECKQLIGQCVATEIYLVMTNQEPFDEQRYVRNLKNLPKEPSA